jgi:hypothetical protein
MRKQKVIDLSNIYARHVPLDVGQERWEKLPFRTKWRIAMIFAAAAGIKCNKGK